MLIGQEVFQRVSVYRDLAFDGLHNGNFGNQTARLFTYPPILGLRAAFFALTFTALVTNESSPKKGRTQTNSTTF